MRKALVTGGCGFIGSNLTHELVKQGWQVDIVDDMSNGHLELLEGLKIRVIPVDLLESFYDMINTTNRVSETVHVIQGDFAHEGICKNISEKMYDIVFHQAAIPRVLFSVENPSLTTNVNIGATTRLFEACIGNVDRVVFASSSSVYGGASILPTLETTEKSPKSPYAWQKHSIEDLAKIFCNLYDIDIVCLRYFNVFGPGQYGDSPYSTAVSAWCHSIKNSLPMRSDGDGTQSRDLCYVDNTVQANILAATSDQSSHGGFNGRCYNIACGDRTTNNEILDFFTERYTHAIVKNAPWRAGDVMHTQADVSSAKEDFGYEPAVRFWDGLNRTIEWWNI
jgi:nucleoside-diphosphate-sugar epimerase